MTLSNETHPAASDDAHRDVWQALWRGFRIRCPSCGVGKQSPRYLKVADACPHCAEELHHHKADDAPAYFTILIVGHLVIPILLWSEITYDPSLLFYITFWPTVTLALSLFLLPRIKGALIGLQWANRMHGFNSNAPDEDELARADKKP